MVKLIPRRMRRKQAQQLPAVSDDDSDIDEANREILYNVEDSVPWHIAVLYIIQVRQCNVLVT